MIVIIKSGCSMSRCDYKQQLSCTSRQYKQSGCLTSRSGTRLQPLQAVALIELNPCAHRNPLRSYWMLPEALASPTMNQGTSFGIVPKLMTVWLTSAARLVQVSPWKPPGHVGREQRSACPAMSIVLGFHLVTWPVESLCSGSHGSSE